MTITASEPRFRYCGGFHRAVTLDLGGAPKRNGYPPMTRFGADQAAKYPEMCAAMRSARMALNRYRGDAVVDRAVGLIDSALQGAGSVAE